jgi:hypothetical protein
MRMHLKKHMKMHLKTHMKVPLEYLIWDALGPMIPNPATLSVSYLLRMLGSSYSQKVWCNKQGLYLDRGCYVHGKMEGQHFFGVGPESVMATWTIW